MSGAIALIVGAGRGSRFGGDTPKQYRLLGGVPVIRRTLMAFLNHPAISAVLPVIHPDDADLFQEASEGLEVLPFVPGGATRQDSVRFGLESVAYLNPSTVLIQDAARPFVDSAMISRVLGALENHDGALPALAVIDTLKRGASGMAVETVDRKDLWRAQTPQGFRFDAILAAHRRYADQPVTDDAALAERAGMHVALVEGTEENVKVTTQEDLVRAEQSIATGEWRTGMGFDVHKIVAGDGMTLCGVRIPGSLSLEGHSDADVALHALTDAVLGAVSQGDIGFHFPPSDPQWRGVASVVFLRRALDLVAEKGGKIAHVDVTIICQKPKIGPWRDQMRHSLAGVLSLDLDRVSVKATTTERLGFTGRGEGIAAQAIATVCLSPQ